MHVYIYIYIYQTRCGFLTASGKEAMLSLRQAVRTYLEGGNCKHYSEGGMIRLETLTELKILNSSCSSLSSY